MRIKEGYSLRDLGELVNISHTLIANIETGKVVPSSETLKDLLKVFNITYRDDEDLIEDFITRFKRVFYGLYMYDYDSVKEDIDYFQDHETTFIHSIVTLEFSLLRFLHSTLLDSLTKQQIQDLDLLLRVTSMMSDSQNQLLFLILGIKLFNEGRYYESYKELKHAATIGDAQIDPLIHLYMIRTQVQMYRFMDAQKLAEETIDRFDNDLNYARSMQVRLELAKSHVHVRKFDSAIEYLNKIELFGTQYKYQYFVDHGHIQRTIIHLLQEDFNRANEEVYKIDHDTTTSLYLKMATAHSLGQLDKVKQYYEDFYAHFKPEHRPREKAFMDVVIYEYGCVDITEEEYVKRLELLVEISLQAHDQELLQHGYSSLIELYRSKRMYKKALELSETMRKIRSFGVLSVQDLY
jgi:transcriptional regulator with XRE-family HTH domain